MRVQGKWDAPPKQWRVRGTAADGLTVTLGRFETAEQAQLEYARLAQVGGYRNLVVQPIDRPPTPAAPGGEAK